MIAQFQGLDEKTHNAFQAWRQANPDGFHMTETSRGNFVIHWTQDKREGSTGRGCHHQGTSTVPFSINGCYTAARKVCSEDVQELREWAKRGSFRVKSCGHCDTKRFPFPDAGPTTPSSPASTQSAYEGQVRELSHLSRDRSESLRQAALSSAAGSCECCQINFSRVLGGAGAAVLQVHHKEPLSMRGNSGGLTVLADLAVLCANCHALVHAFGPDPITVSELRHRLAGDSSHSTPGAA